MQKGKGKSRKEKGKKGANDGGISNIEQGMPNVEVNFATSTFSAASAVDSDLKKQSQSARLWRETLSTKP